MKTLFHQCELKTGKDTQVAWLPKKHCEVGHKVELKMYPGLIWSIIFVGSHSTDNPPDYRKFIRSHRLATGDSLPKFGEIKVKKV